VRQVLTESVHGTDAYLTGDDQHAEPRVLGGRERASRASDGPILTFFTAPTVDMHGEVARLLPVYYQKSFEEALQDAAALFEDPVLLKRTHRHLSRLGGSSKKTDALQQVILEEVQKRPAITVTDLLKHLQSLQDLRQVVDDIDEEAISFTDRNGHPKNAPISGLKDRLSRAKKALKSR